MKIFDCVVCGSCTADILVRPVDLAAAIGTGMLHRIEPVELLPGGIVSNAGVTLARLEMRTAAFSAVGADRWGGIVRDLYGQAGIATDSIQTNPRMPTSTSVVVVDADGNRSFLHCQGAPKGLTIDDYRGAMPLFAASRAMLLGYYPLLPGLLEHLPGFFREIRSHGCLTALDASGGGGSLQPLDVILPHLDVYCPSRVEAESQTDQRDPQAMIETFRACGAPGILGVKLGSEGALLRGPDGAFIKIDAISPPAAVVDTTGAGDVFYAALLAARLRNRPLEEAGRIAAAAAALSTTALGGTAAAFSWEDVTALAGVRRR